MRTTPLAALALCIGAAACASTPAPDTAPGALLIAPLEAPPVYALLGHRTELRLTSEQITELDSIGQALNAVNGPRYMRLRELRGDFRGRSPSGQQVRQPEEVRGLVEEIRQDNQRATEGVREVLTVEQQRRTCQLFREGDQQRARRERVGNGPPAAGPRARRMPASDMAPRPTWSWCGESLPAETPAAGATDSSAAEPQDG